MGGTSTPEHTTARQRSRDGAGSGFLPIDERRDERRVAALRRVGLLDTPADEAFDEVVRFAAHALQTPMAAFSLIDADRQWYKSTVGMDGITETARDIAFCNQVVVTDAPVLVDDALADPRFADSPLVHGGPRARSYVGVPIHAFGEPIGALCVLDHRPRGFAEDELCTLRFLAHQVEHLVDLVCRRSSSTPPARQVVVDLAARLSAGEPFHAVAPVIDRPAWIYDTATLGIVAVNDIAVEHYGWTRDEFLRRSILDMRPPADRRVLAAAIDNSEIDRYSASRLWRHIRADGQSLDVRISSAAATHLGRQVRLVLVTDVTERITLDDAVDRATMHDPATGLPNRRALLATLAERLDADASTAVLCVDIDRFKLVNEMLGHEVADVLLAAVAARIRQCTSSADLVARTGGDEFAIVRASASEDEAWLFAEELRRIIEHPFLLDDAEHFVSASVGLAMVSPGATAAGLVAEAEAALDEAKADGVNTVAVFDQALRRRIAESTEVHRDLQGAIERHEIDLDVQPIVDLATGAVSYEALARWNHPTRGRLSPATFIPVAEEFGLIRRLGDQLLDLGARHAAELGAPVSVNVSMRQFDRALVHRVATVIDDYGLTPGQLVIEITESAVVDDAHASVVLAGLRAAGADIWIDDFGTGYSSLGRLSSLTVDGLKLPREFVADLDTPHGWGIASAIVALARAFDIEVIAEGVETEHQLEQVHQLGCDAAQGYHLGRPRPYAEEFAARRARAATA